MTHINERRFQETLNLALNQFQAVFGYWPTPGSIEHQLCYCFAEETEKSFTVKIDELRGMLPVLPSHRELDNVAREHSSN